MKEGVLCFLFLAVAMIPTAVAGAIDAEFAGQEARENFPPLEEVMPSPSPFSVSEIGAMGFSGVATESGEGYQSSSSQSPTPLPDLEPRYPIYEPPYVEMSLLDLRRYLQDYGINIVVPPVPTPSLTDQHPIYEAPYVAMALIDLRLYLQDFGINIVVPAVPTPNPRYEESVSIPHQMGSSFSSLPSGEFLSDTNSSIPEAEPVSHPIEEGSPEGPYLISTGFGENQENSFDAEVHQTPEPTIVTFAEEASDSLPSMTLDEIRAIKSALQILDSMPRNLGAVEQLRRDLSSTSFRVRESTMMSLRQALISETATDIYGLYWDNGAANVRRVFANFVKSQLLLQLIQQNSSLECTRRTQILLAELQNSLREALGQIDYPALLRRDIEERVRQQLAPRGDVYLRLAERLDSAIHYSFSADDRDEFSDVRCQELEGQSRQRFISFYRELLAYSGDWICGAGQREEIFDLDEIGCHYATACSPDDSLISSLNLRPEEVSAVRSELSHAAITVANRRIRIVGAGGDEHWSSIDLAELSVTSEAMLFYAVGLGLLNPADLLGSLQTVNLPPRLEFFGMEVGGFANSYSPIYFLGPDLQAVLNHCVRIALGLPSQRREVT